MHVRYITNIHTAKYCNSEISRLTRIVIFAGGHHLDPALDLEAGVLLVDRREGVVGQELRERRRLLNLTSISSNSRQQYQKARPFDKCIVN